MNINKKRRGGMTVANKSRIHTTLHLGAQAVKNLSPKVQRTLEAFFADVDLTEFGGLSFFGTSVQSKANPQHRVRHLTSLPNTRNLPGFGVSVWVEGKQGVTGFLSCISPQKQNDLLSLVEHGVPKKQPVPKQAQELQVIRPTTPVPTNGTLPQKEMAIPASQETFLKTLGGEEGITESKMNKKLLESGLPQHDIDLLRIFISELMDPYLEGFTEGNTPEFVTIPCSFITAKILKDLKIKSPRGGVGNVYSTFIAHFGFKKDEEIPKGERHTPWHLHTKTVLDFTKGLHKVPKKAQHASGNYAGRESQATKPHMALQRTEEVSPLSMLFAMSGSENVFPLYEKLAGQIPGLEAEILKRQNLNKQLAEQRVLKRDEMQNLEAVAEQILYHEQEISKLETSRSQIQVSLAQRNARISELEGMLVLPVISKEEAEALRSAYATISTFASLAGVDLSKK